MFIIFLTGCSLSEKELVETMVADQTLTGDCIRLYAVFETEAQAFRETFDFDLSDTSKEAMLHSVIRTWDRSEWNYSKVFNIDEYPTFLVVDYEQVLFQTTNFKEADKFISERATECTFEAFRDGRNYM